MCRHIDRHMLVHVSTDTTGYHNTETTATVTKKKIKEIKRKLKKSDQKITAIPYAIMEEKKCY